MSYNDVRWTDSERDFHRNTEHRYQRKAEPKIVKSVNLPKSIVARVEDLQREHEREYGVGLSFSAALASIIAQAPQFKLVPPAAARR